MDWPKELLTILDDPLFAHVHPRAPRATEDAVVREGFRSICEWCRSNAGVPPRLDKRNREEWLMARRLRGFIEDDAKREMLRSADEYGLLDTVYDD